MEALDKEGILKIIQNDSWMIHVLQLVRDEKLPDWWIGAGFVRSKIWDYLHGYTTRTPIPDVDVIYFDPKNFSEITEKNIEKNLSEKMPQVKWQARNQARMHILHHDIPYKNASDGLSRWVETVTCIGIKIDESNKLQLTAPLGIEDLTHLIIRPNPTIPFDKSLFKKRVREKHWLIKWPNLRIILPS